ncbi:MAG: Gfo/Idh/MocA family oxidoreductase [Candidatus Latescibacteria bacterium]|nr:Gfo/Idh/MocA family oxidoreductase [Candidatus Latescibacterota bacterium]
MGDTFGFGIIGAGVISSYHAKAIEAHPDGKIVAVADVVKANAEKFAAEYNCEIYTDWREMLKRDDIQAINVCSPSGLHAEHTIGAAKAGKHIIVEKSMAINVKDATSMIRVARDNKVRLAVIFQKRTEEAPNKVKKAIADGMFGKMVFGDASIKYWRNQAYYDSADWRGTWAQEGGGSTMTQGIHGIDLLLYMMGDVEKIYATMDTVAHVDIEVEDIALALLKFKNGAYGRLQTATACNPGSGNVFEINGTLGTAILVEDTITSWAFSDSKETVAKETIVGVKGEAGTAASSYKTFPVEGHIMQMANFIDAVRDGKNLICSGEDGRKSLVLIEALYTSARRGEEVFLDEILEGNEI